MLLLRSSFLPGVYNLTDIHGVYACREIGIHLLGCITLEILRFKGCSIHENAGVTAIARMATNAVITVLFFIFMYAITT